MPLDGRSRPDVVDARRTTAAADARSAGVDATRFVAACAVALLHAMPLGRARHHLEIEAAELLTRFAVPFFFIASGYFGYRGLNRPVASTRRILFRLLPVYVVWITIYAVLAPGSLASLARHPTIYLHDLRVAEPGFHLWFLPALGVGMVCALLAFRLSPVLAASLGALAFGLVLALGAYRGVLGVPGFPMRGGALVAFPDVAIGLWIAHRRPVVGRGTAWALAAAGVACCGAEAFLLHRVGGAGGIPDTLAGTSLFATGIFLAVLPPARASRVIGVLARLGRLSLGIYCAHLLFILWVERWAVPASLGETVALGVGAVLFGLAVSLAFARAGPLVRLVR